MRLGLLEKERVSHGIVAECRRARIGLRANAIAEVLPGIQNQLFGTLAKIATRYLAKQIIERRRVAPAMPGAHFRHESSA